MAIISSDISPPGTHLCRAVQSLQREPEESVCAVPVQGSGLGYQASTQGDVRIRQRKRQHGSQQPG
jgi:hypothetical protein